MKKFPPLYILITYALTLGLVAVLNGMYPVEVAFIIQRVSSPKIDLSTSDYARYRIALFLSATALLVVLFPFVRRLGAKLAAQNPPQLPTWRHFFTAVFWFQLLGLAIHLYGCALLAGQATISSIIC